MDRTNIAALALLFSLISLLVQGLNGYLNLKLARKLAELELHLLDVGEKRYVSKPVFQSEIRRLEERAPRFGWSSKANENAG